MSTPVENERQKIITSLITHIKKKLNGKQAKLLSQLIPQYYANVPLEDLQARTVEDLCGAVLSHWELFYQRQPHEYKRRIFNPNYEKDGWQTSHTVLQFVMDDQPFLVDTVCMEINRKGFSIHLRVHLGGVKVRRNAKGQILDILAYDEQLEDAVIEAPIYIEIDRQTDTTVLNELAADLDRVLQDAQLAVQDWGAMRKQLQQALTELKSTKDSLNAKEVAESRAFLEWLADDHFTFLGFRNYEMVGQGKELALRLIPGSGLGVLQDESGSKITRYISELPIEARRLALSQQILLISKTNTRATVHSNRYTDYVGVKRFDAQGKIIGERRFIGLYTSNAYHSPSRLIPIIRQKVAEVISRAGFPLKGHAAKTLAHILETLPRDDLFQASSEELYELSMGIFQLQDRRKIKLFARKDAYGRFISCLVYMPRDNVHTELLYHIQDELEEAFKALEITFDTHFSDSILARIHYTVRIDSHNQPTYDLKEIEKKIIEIGRSWKDELQEYLLDYFGEERGNTLVTQYRRAFPAAYRESFSPRLAIADIEHIERLSPHHLLEMSFYRPLGAPGNVIHFKLFRANHTIPLSDALPILENMGLRVIGEQPYELIFKDDSRVWINDFSMLYPREANLSVDKNKQIFQDAFNKIWHGQAENDGFNHLILGAQLNWREISVLRAYAKYLRQIGFTFSQNYMELTLSTNTEVAKLLIELFKYRFDPELQREAGDIQVIEEQLTKEFDSVANLDQDRILRMFHNLILATTRTNYFQLDAEGNPKPYLSFKFMPNDIAELPLPKPKYEIFVYSPRFEGIHLRAGKTARGGIRWSDRREDFRTEVLGLMRAQQVKNAVIVPTGAKGGFVPKYLPLDGSREEIIEEAISCYKNYMRGLLDLTDNLQGNEIIHPRSTIYYDEDDPYLVVAADKGTATFSDIANSVAKEYNFWLGDAFASGGSTGYDHKKMGITARGAWESVKNHFRELGIDIYQTHFTAIGIGDMAGDVFGNGMLLSENIKLLAAFNHQHIFIDPDPDPKTSFEERKRLFNLTRSTWEDYNPELISKGGGVFRRSAKSIRLTPEIKAAFNIKKDSIIPSELIKTILKSPVDLLWNGGIGTFIKASTEVNSEAGDRANDVIRVNGNELQCRIIAEGGNLGFTQLARIEYEANGGKINTDFIDNSAGVDCSDHEVNIKILLNSVVSAGDMTEKQRNVLLSEMTQEVAQLVLHNNYRQARAISIASIQSIEYMTLYSRYINDLDKQGKIDRVFEYLPDDKMLIERKTAGKGLSRPELAVLSAYSKIFLKDKILKSDIPEDSYLIRYVELAFPKVLRKRFSKQMTEHRLVKEIVATQLSNSIITDMGVAFVYQMQDETRASAADIVRAYTVSKEIFKLTEFFTEVESLDYKISAEKQIEMILDMIRLIRRSTRWFLRNQRSHLNIQETIELFGGYIQQIYKSIPSILVGSEKEYFDNSLQELLEAGVPKAIAMMTASARAMYSTLNIVEAATEYNADINQVAQLYFSLADLLGLNQFREFINNYRVDNHWSVLARSAVKADLDWQQRALTIGVLKMNDDMKSKNIDELITAWLAKYKPLVERWQTIFADMRGTLTTEYSMLAVGIRELNELAQASLYGGNGFNTYVNSNVTEEIA